MTVRPVAPQIELGRMSLRKDTTFASRKTHLPRILSISSHFLTSFTYFRWNVLTVGLSWRGKKAEVEWERIRNTQNLTLLTSLSLWYETWQEMDRNWKAGRTVAQNWCRACSGCHLFWHCLTIYGRLLHKLQRTVQEGCHERSINNATAVSVHAQTETAVTKERTCCTRELLWQVSFKPVAKLELK